MIRNLSLLLSTWLVPALAFGQLPKITFTPQWLPQAQFAGYYVALEKGFYEAEGIEVEIIHPSASLMATERLMKGETDVISLFLISALSKRSEAFDLVNIDQLSQNSGLLFVAKKTAGIDTLSDLDGKRIGIWKSGFDEIPKALVRANNYQVEWVPILSSINLFMIGGIDAMTVMWYNEYDQIINSGINPDELSTFFLKDYGYNIPEDGIYCLKKTLLQRKEDLKKFVQGTDKGWEYAKTHKAETLQLVLRIMKENHIATNLTHQSWMLDRTLELFERGSKNIAKGTLAESDFYTTQRILQESGSISEKTSYTDFHQNLLEE